MFHDSSFRSKPAAVIHCWPFLHALIVSLYVITFGFHVPHLHLPQQAYRSDPLLALLARAGRGTVFDHRSPDVPLLHLPEKVYCFYPLLALLARTLLDR